MFFHLGMDSMKGASLWVEEYDPRSNKWKQVSTLTTRRLQFGVAVLDNKLYVAGKLPILLSPLSQLSPIC